MTQLSIVDVTVEYRSSLLGTDIARPRMSWKLSSQRRGAAQQAYTIQAAYDESFEEMVWDSGETKSSSSLHIEYGGPELSSRTRYYFRVKVRDTDENESAWSAAAWFETAFLKGAEEWQASWITPAAGHIDPQAEPAFLLRKPFSLRGERVASARVYATAAGVYDLYLNGDKIGDALLAPGWTSYNKRLQYQTYDVTEQLREGANSIGIAVANGWYKGRLGWENQSNHYGDRRAALVQLHVVYKDGTEDVIVSDSTWQSSTGAVQLSEIYDGETYDARLEQRWSEPGFDDAAWGGVDLLDLPLSVLVAQENVPTRVTETISPIAVIVTPEGDMVLDMGQNMVGRMRITVEAPSGTVMTLQHAEVLDKDGNFYPGNIRTAKQLVTYIAKGEGIETYAPHFTFQGFRYVRVKGFPRQEAGLSINSFVGEVIHSDMQRTGTFACSDPLVNQLQSNITWGQRGNFLDVPTDCPQRDERLGWTGDAQVFVGTALFNYNGGQFFTKWLRDLEADQLPEGGVPFVVPNIVKGYSSAAWGDAATVIPWAVYTSFGDKRMLAEQYGSMKAWVDYIRSQGEQEAVWNTGFHFGDWLALDAKENSYMGATPPFMVTAAYFALSTRIVRDAAAVLGLHEDAAYYGELAERIVAEYRKEFITPNGRVAAPTQTAHVLALVFDLAEEKDRKRIASELNELIVSNDYHLTTGFVGTPYLCFALSQNGYHETAVKLLLQQTYPSWLYSVTKGATTIWEHWDGIKQDGSFWSDDMNSFNHYAYGAVGEWMYRSVAGLAPDSSEPGYKKVRIEPQWNGGGLTHAEATYDSMYGLYKSGWTLSAEQAELRIEVPANGSASVLLPGAQIDEVLEGETAISEADGIRTLEQTEDGVRFELGAGSYTFCYARPLFSYKRYSDTTLMRELIEWESARAILERHVPGISGNLGFLGGSPLMEAAHHPMGGIIPKDKLDIIVEELSALRE